MSANTETTGADRTKCKAWCGLNFLDLAVPMGERGQWLTNGQLTAGAHVEFLSGPEAAWCSADCRDARLPPIAAPAAHIERRKVEVGQRRKNHQETFTIYAIECARAIVCQVGQVDAVNGYVHKGDNDCCWELVSVLEDCELLADATPEPAKCAAKSIETCCAADGCCAEVDAECGKCGMRACWSHAGEDHVCVKSPPAQEAPKAAPVCWHAKRGDGPCVGPVAVRTIGCRGTALSMCDGHMLLRERIIVCQMEAQTGTPYAGPERLPKPQLAADWVEDCLPESGR